MGREATRPFEHTGARAMRSTLWSDFSFVVSSGYRERVIRALSTKPKLPKQLALETGVRLVHVSRALRELRNRGLVELLTPEARARGRLYGVTEGGYRLTAYLEDTGSRYQPASRGPTATVQFVPKVRATPTLRVIDYLRETKGREKVAGALRGWSVNADQLSDDDWFSITALDEFIELIESAFGDGTYEVIRSAFEHGVPRMSSIRRQILKAIPLSALAERAPIVYNQEVNFGRLVVKVGRRKASFMHFDWSPTPGICAMFRGVYQGVLRGRKVEGKVSEIRCVRSGDAYCEYLVEW